MDVAGPGARGTPPRRGDLRGQDPEGARPGELPIRQFLEPEFVVNASTASLPGLAVPRSIVLRAGEVSQ
jgi:hypothetical protein